MSPTGQITCGDNEGTFVPRCPIHWIDKGEFLGVVDAAANYASMNTTTTVAQRRGNRDKHLDPGEAPVPLAWLPKSVDNSNGGQVWVTSKRWGPFQGEMLHLSYGQSALYLVLKQKCGDLIQGGVVRIPVRPTSSAMRGRFNKRDGQLYVAGLRGWQTNAAREGGLDRVRYTGRIEPSKEIFKEIKKFKEVPTIVFPRGVSLKNYITYSNIENLNCLSLDQFFDLKNINKLNPNKTLQGNLNPEILRNGGENLNKEILEILLAFKETPHIFNLGHGVIKDTPIKNVVQTLELIRS